jgi:citrate synthase
MHDPNDQCADDAAEVVRSTDYLSRADALRILGVKPQTLYSYVSRGLIRRLRHPTGGASHYNYQDLQRVKARSAARSGHGAVAASAIHWGEPILDTRITEITPGGPRYRKRLGVDLVRENYSFESVAEYLWLGDEPAPSRTWSDEPDVGNIPFQLGDLFRAHPDIHIRQLMTSAVLLRGLASRHGNQEPTSWDDDTEVARELIQTLVGAFGFLGPEKAYAKIESGESISHALLRVLGVATTEKNMLAMNGALVLVADHELTPATFAARIAASVHSDMHSCIGAALQVHFGSMFGLRCDRVEQALGEREGDDDAAFHEPESSVGFHHPLYTNGDPRAMALLEIAIEIERGRPGSCVQTGHSPIWNPELITIEEALVALCRSLGVARQTAGGLLALGRAAGWVAHVIEQRKDDFVIRPRGKFLPALPS